MVNNQKLVCIISRLLNVQHIKVTTLWSTQSIGQCSPHSSSQVLSFVPKQYSFTIFNMRSLTCVCLLAFLGVALARPEHYTDRYDNVNLDEIISNKRLLLPYIKCSLDQGRCSPDGKELKSHIREALENKCAKCTPVQQNGTRKVIGYLINNEPQWWDQLVTKYDPKRRYVVEYESELRKVKASG